RDLAGLLDQSLLLDETAEVRLVQADAGQSLDRLLELEEGEGGWHQFEDDRPVLDLAAQAADGGREDAAMVGPHRLADARPGGAAGLGDEPRLVEQFVAFEHPV